MTKRGIDKDPHAEYLFPIVERMFSDVEVFKIAGELRDDRGSPDQARELLAQFVVAAGTPAGPCSELVTFVRDALAQYLLEGKSLEAAFRLRKGRRGRPNAEETRRHAIAEDMLRRQVVNRMSYEEAALATAEAMNSSRTPVCDAYSSYRMAALHKLTRGKPPVIDIADLEQRRRLTELFPGFVGEEPLPPA
jgi:hypothetical protein